MAFVTNLQKLFFFFRKSICCTSAAKTSGPPSRWMPRLENDEMATSIPRTTGLGRRGRPDSWAPRRSRLLQVRDNEDKGYKGYTFPSFVFYINEILAALYICRWGHARFLLYLYLTSFFYLSTFILASLADVVWSHSKFKYRSWRQFISPDWHLERKEHRTLNACFPQKQVRYTSLFSNDDTGSLQLVLIYERG